METFETSSDFLDYIKRTQTKRFSTSAKNEEFARITQTDGDRLTKSLPDGHLYTSEPYQNVINLRLNSIYSVLTTEQLDSVRNNVAVGPLSHEAVNARILKSSNSKYAIVINSGLMTLLNDFIQLGIASVYPNSVSYFDGRSLAEMTSEDYLQIMDDTAHTYATSGVIKPNWIKLDISGSSRDLKGGFRSHRQPAAEEQDPCPVVLEVAEAPCCRLDRLDLAVESLHSGIGDPMTEVC